MSIIKANIIRTFELPKLSPKQNIYVENKWDSAYMKKFISKKWPYEKTKSSLLQDFWAVLSSSVN